MDTEEDQQSDSSLSDENQAAIITGASSILLKLAGAVGPQTTQPQAGGAGASGPGTQPGGGSGGAHAPTVIFSAKNMVLIGLGSALVIGLVIWIAKK